MSIDFENSLNQEQIEACCTEDSILLIACPGSGKTRTLIYKIIYELEKLKENQFIVAITYTNIAADEISHRVEELGVNIDKLWIGTIHSFCLEWILKPYGSYLECLCYGYTIINQFDSEKLITDLCKKYKNPKINFFDCSYRYEKCGMILHSHEITKHDNIRLAIKDYHFHLEENRLLDFEQILNKSYELIEKLPEISKNLAALFKWVLIDEFQDTRDIQYEILNKILRSGNGKVSAFYVGDPNQSIFTSLGGYPITHNALCQNTGIDFKKRFLSTNYRSTINIINFFSGFKIYESKIQHFKGNNKDSGVFYNKKIQKEELSKEIGRILDYVINKKGLSQEQICIICPQWMPLASITRELSGLFPTLTFDGPGMAPFGRDNENFWYKVSKIALTTPSPDIYLRRRRWARDIMSHLSRCEINIEMDISELLYRLNKIKIESNHGIDYLTEYFHLFCKEIGESISQHHEIKNHYSSFFSSTVERLKKLQSEKVLDVDTTEYFRKVFKPKSGIVISTVHGAKGTEFDCVIAYGLVEGMIPFFKDPDQKGSARKSIYVIGSRAKRYLFMISENRNDRPPTTVLSEYVYVYDTF